MGDDALIERGVALLSYLEHGELDLAAVIDRLELVTEDPQRQRAIIDRAIAEDVIERAGTTIRPTSGTFLRFEADVRSVEGDFSCRRCGAGLSRGYFIELADGELGPFGSTCIRKVTGRE